MGNKLPECAGYPKGITGKLITGHVVKQNDARTFQWQGGEVIGLLRSLLETKDTGFKRFGDKVFVGGFKLELTAYYPQVKMYLAKRLTDG